MNNKKPTLLPINPILWLQPSQVRVIRFEYHFNLPTAHQTQWFNGAPPPDPPTGTGTQPDTTEARRTGDALIHRLQRLLAADPDNQQLRYDLAKAHLNCGLTLQGLGGNEHLNQAIGHHHRAIELWEALVDAQPDDPPLQYDLAKAHYNCGNTLLDLGGSEHRNQATDHYHRVIELGEALVDAQPDDPQFRSVLAGAHNNCGNTLCGLGGSEHRNQAIDHYHRAIELGEALVDAQPDDPQFRSDLARAHYNYGNTLRGLGGSEHLNQAIGHYHRAIEFWEALVDAQPDDPQLRYDLGRAHHNCGITLHDLGGSEHLNQAIGHHHRVIELGEALFDAQPDDPQLRFDLARAHTACGSTLHDLGGSEHLNQAIGHFHRAIELGEALVDAQPDDPQLLVQPALAYFNCSVAYDTLGTLPDAIEMVQSALQRIAAWPSSGATPKSYENLHVVAFVHLCHLVQKLDPAGLPWAITDWMEPNRPFAADAQLHVQAERAVRRGLVQILQQPAGATGVRVLRDFAQRLALWRLLYFAGTSELPWIEAAGKLEAGDARAALEQIERGLETLPGHPALLYHRARLHFLSGDQGAGRQGLIEVLEALIHRLQALYWSPAEVEEIRSRIAQLLELGMNSGLPQLPEMIDQDALDTLSDTLNRWLGAAQQVLRTDAGKLFTEQDVQSLIGMTEQPLDRLRRHWRNLREATDNERREQILRSTLEQWRGLLFRVFRMSETLLTEQQQVLLRAMEEAFAHFGEEWLQASQDGGTERCAAIEEQILEIIERRLEALREVGESRGLFDDAAAQLAEQYAGLWEHLHETERRCIAQAAALQAANAMQPFSCIAYAQALEHGLHRRLLQPLARKQPNTEAPIEDSDAPLCAYLQARKGQRPQLTLGQVVGPLARALKNPENGPAFLAEHLGQIAEGKQKARHLLRLLSLRNQAAHPAGQRRAQPDPEQAHDAVIGDDKHAFFRYAVTWEHLD